MQKIKLYQYAVIRLVPRVEREEFFNIGLILSSKKAKYIRVQFHLCPDKFHLMRNTLDFDEVKQSLENFRNIAEGNKAGGPMALLEADERFNWLTAVKSSVIQTSSVHPGRTKDLDATFERLFDELVL